MKTISFGDLFEFVRNGMNVRQNADAGGLPITRIETISAGEINPSKVGFAGVSESEAKHWLLRNGDVLMSHINSVEHVGKCALYRSEPTHLVHGMNLLCLRPKKNEVDPSFVVHLIRSSGFRSKLSNYVNKAVNQASVSTTNLKQISVTIPTFSEQRRIAAILDHADALRNKRRQALSKLDTVTDALFLEMFGDPVRNSLAWPLSNLLSLGQIFTGKTPPSGITNLFGGDIPFVTPGDLGEDNLRAKRFITKEGSTYCKLVRNGSTFVCCIGATIGKMGLATDFSAFNQQINAISWNAAVNDIYGYRAMRFFKSRIAQLGTSTTLPILNKSAFEKLKIPVPPIDAQVDFSRRATKLREDRPRYISASQMSDALFHSLQHRAFRGEL